MKKLGTRRTFFIKTLRLPRELAPLPCNLHGPATGEPAVSEAEVFYARRGNRKGESRMCRRPTILSRQVTVVAGPFEGQPCVLYTAYGGPEAPREPWDESLQGSPSAQRASVAFWKKHALGTGD